MSPGAADFEGRNTLFVCDELKPLLYNRIGIRELDQMPHLLFGNENQIFFH